MQEELKIQLRDFKKQYTSYKEYLEDADWTVDYDIEDSYKTEADIINNIIRDIKNFSKENENSLHLKPVQEFFKFCNSIIDLHSQRIDFYLQNNDWKQRYKNERDEIVQKIKELEEEGVDEITKILLDDYKKLLSDLEGEKRKEIKFQNDIFTQGRRIRVEALTLNIDVENNTISPHLFHANKKASLIMRSFLYDKESHLKEKTDALDINWESPNPSTSKELYINMNPKDIPPYDEKKHFFEQPLSTIQFWEEEIKKIKYGINLGGYHLSPFIYYYMNFHQIPVGSELDKGTMPASFRDNEYFFEESLKEAREKGYDALVLYGTRRFGKSAVESAFLTHGHITIQGCVGNIIGFSTKDLGEVLNYINVGVNNIPNAIRPIIDVFDTEREIIFGVKKTAQQRLEQSKLHILNLDGGTKKSSGQKPAGGTPDRILMDEIGKGDALTPYLALRPALAGGADGKPRTTIVMAGCVCAGSKVYTSEGKIVNIEQLTKEDGIIGFNGETVSKETISWMREPIKKECYRITTVGGNSIECSYDHPFLSYTDKPNSKTLTGVRAKDLKVGQKLIVPDYIPLFGELEEDDAWLYGYSVGDGSYGKRSLELITSDEVIYEYINSKYNTKNSRITHSKNGTTVRRLLIKDVANKLRSNGMLGKTHCNKTLPNNIHQYNKKSLASFIAGYYDADGSVKINKGKMNIKLHSKCRDLLENMKYLLLKFGIHSNIYLDKKAGSSVIKGKTYFRKELFVLSIQNNTDCKRFYENIKLISPEKNKKIEKCLEHNGKGNPVKNNINFALNTENNKFKKYEGKRISNFRNVRIKSIEYIGEKDVYNLTADNTNTYLANSFVTSNTAGSSELSKSAEKMLKNTEAYGILPMNYDLLERISDPEEITWERKKFATFVPTQMSLYVPKIKTNLADFLKIDNSELKKIPFEKTDWKKGKEFFIDRRKKTEGDYTANASEISSHPLDPDDVYLSGTQNKFNAIGMRKHQNYLKENELTGRKYWFTPNMNGGVDLTLTNEPIIDQYPYGGGAFNAPVNVFEYLGSGEDYQEPPFGLYVIGLDDVKHDQSDGDSVISVTVYKRNWELSEWADRIVCTYATRPERKEEAYKVIRLIMKYYNAIVFPENEDEGFKDFLERRHKIEAIKHLAEGVDFSRSLNLDHNNNRLIGFSATLKNVNRLNSRVLAYTQDPIEEDGELDGYMMINDIMLLEEMINNKPGANADRIRSFGLSLLYAEYLDKNNLYISRRRWGNNTEPTENKKKVTKHSGLISKKFTKKRRPF